MPSAQATSALRPGDALRIQVRGTRRPWLKSAAVGALIGGAGLALAGLSDGDDHCSGPGWCLMTFSAEGKAVLGLVAGGILGGATGLVVGALTKTAVWKPVPRDRVWVSPAVGTEGRIGVVVRLTSR